MSEIIFYVLLVFAAILTYRFVRGFSKRVFLMAKLNELKKENGAEIKYNTLPFFSLIRFSGKPEITVTIGNTVYLIRLIGAKSKFHRVHFANENYTVTVRGKLSGGGGKIMVQRAAGGPRPVGGGRFIHVNRDYFVRKIGKVRILPSLESDAARYEGKQVVPVLIFNPAPHEVTYVTKEKNRVVAAFTGDTVYSQMIFTASSFVRYADRCARAQREEKRQDSELEYYPS